MRGLPGRPGDRDQREAEVAEPGQQAVQRRLVGDLAPDDGGARRRLARSRVIPSNQAAQRSSRRPWRRISYQPGLVTWPSALA